MVAGDIPALDAILADELRYTHSSGRVETNAFKVANVKRILRTQVARMRCFNFI